jgi:hypothetical protein
VGLAQRGHETSQSNIFVGAAFGHIIGIAICVSTTSPTGSVYFAAGFVLVIIGRAIEKEKYDTGKGACEDELPCALSHSLAAMPAPPSLEAGE